MKEQEALEKVCEMIEKEGIWKVEKKLVEALKKYYCVEDLHFFKGMGWTYATEEDPLKRWMAHGNVNDYKILGFHDLAWALTEGTLCCSRERLTGKDLKERGLIKKLAGI